jgi:hypothetical protein
MVDGIGQGEQVLESISLICPPESRMRLIEPETAFYLFDLTHSLIRKMGPFFGIMPSQEPFP